MGHRTIQNVPSDVRKYGRAKWIHDTSKPIRGRDPIVRPLGARRDCDTYRVRMDNDVVEFVLYKTPVIRYYPTGEIEITTAGWSTVSTHQMLWHVLGIKASGVRGKTVVEDDMGKRYVMDSETKLVFKPDGYGRLLVVDHAVMCGYRINRKAYNIVRARYKEFAEYIKTFASLRAVEGVSKYGNYAFHEISYTIGEAAQVLGTCVDPRKISDPKALVVATHVWSGLTVFPTRQWANNDTHKDKFDRCAEKFFALCRNDQPEESKHVNFHKAAMVLLTYGDMLFSAGEGDLTNVRTTRYVGMRGPITTFDELLKKFHRNEILERFELAAGQTPNPTYLVWME